MNSPLLAPAPLTHAQLLAMAKPAHLRLVRPTLEVDCSGKSFTFDGVEAEVGKPLARILCALVRAHKERPGTPVSPTTLIEAGWPDERLMPRSGGVRLRNAIARLRSAGLRPVLTTVGRSYILSRDLTIRIR